MLGSGASIHFSDGGGGGNVRKIYNFSSQRLKLCMFSSIFLQNLMVL